MSLLAVAGAGALLGGLASTMYNIWNNERDRDYQDQLQGEIFNREDNAVQRRMLDLEKAGLNPNLAGGSGANAGAVVGRSTSPQMNFGASIGQALDAANAVAQIKKQETENQILNNQRAISGIQLQMARRENKVDEYNQLINQASLLYQLTGKSDINAMYEWNKNDNMWHFNLMTPDMFGEESESGKWLDGTPWMSRKISDAPFLKLLQLQNQNQQNAASMLQNNADWQNVDRIFDYANSVGNLFSSGMSGFGSFSAGRKNMRYWR